MRGGRRRRRRRRRRTPSGRWPRGRREPRPWPCSWAWRIRPWTTRRTGRTSGPPRTMGAARGGGAARSADDDDDGNDDDDDDDAPVAHMMSSSSSSAGGGAARRNPPPRGRRPRIRWRGGLIRDWGRGASYCWFGCGELRRASLFVGWLLEENGSSRCYGFCATY